MLHVASDPRGVGPMKRFRHQTPGAFQLSVARLERIPNANHRIHNGPDCAFLEEEFVRLYVLDLQCSLSWFFQLTYLALQCAV